MTLRLATAVSAYPFYNFRYLKLLQEFSKRFVVYCFAGSRLKGSAATSTTPVYVRHVLPFTLPRRVRYRVGPYLSQLWINAVEHDVVWLFDTAAPMHPLLFRRPVVVDVEDSVLVLPQQTTARKTYFSRFNEYRVLRNRRVAKIVVTTEIIRRKLMKLGIGGEKIEVIPYGVDTKLFRPTSLPDVPVVLYYGTFQPHRSRLLLEFVRTLSQMRKDVCFLLIGDIPPAVRRRLIEYASARVEMPVFIPHDQLPRWLQKARVCILPQDKPFGRGGSLKLIEYMATGRPVVATDVDESFPIKESGAGIVTPVEPKAMAEAVVKLLDDRPLCERLAVKGVEYAARFDWGRMVAEYVRVLQEAASHR
ncbi:MAG: glycosyltransferase family 4 protein [Candidatus Caldarchaeum sp.]